ncbi:class I SAM-dependent methyltransferase [Winogradskyella eckloniae]|uniref:class I SAM-dependent methyltransferase n=1 Tax=Winogradskyella eckloniae TaxID=1089306 RepID=UPI00156668E7|nr:class I SAM-dependent methyltransferase [Winogradskyella eckloniae]NRD20578.1 class I SAM-dependent methyltransferase [Winogradskyella eckloniae]
MVADIQNLNAERYSNELFDLWANKESLNTSEAYVLKKYLIDTTKNVLEAGTGGGRLSFQIEKMGFSNGSAFDIVPEMVSHAKKRASKTNSSVNFRVSDAANLSEFKSDNFDYLIYLQQVLCFIDKEELFLKALNEAYRVAKKDAIVIFSFLDYESKFYNPMLSTVVNTLRKFRHEKISKHHLPWLKINNDINWKLFNKNQPKTYWVTRKKIIAQLMDIGFIILESKNANQLLSDNKKGKGILYIVCKK